MKSQSFVLLATVDTSLVAVHVSGAKARLPSAADRQKFVAVGTWVLCLLWHVDLDKLYQPNHERHILSQEPH